MGQEWRELTKLTQGRKIVIERIRIPETGISIEGEFELPDLVNLPAEEQVFLAAFVRSHGSIKQMEKYFGVSYPTIKNRLNRIAEMLEFVEIETGPDRSEALNKLDQGEISVEEAIKRLKEGDRHE
jgi:hypothetical protein